MPGQQFWGLSWDPSHIQGHAARVTSVVFSPNGQYLGTGSWDTTARVWDLDKGMQIACLKVCGQVISCKVYVQVINTLV